MSTRKPIVQRDPTNGKGYQARLWNPRGGKHGTGAYESKRFATKPHAWDWIRDRTAELEQGVIAPNKVGTFGAELDRWIAHVKVTCKCPRTYIVKRTSVNRVPDTLRNVPLRDLDVMHLEAFRANLATEYAPNTVKLTMGHIRQCLATAVRARRIGRNPATDMDRMPVHAGPAKRAITQAEVFALRDAMPDSYQIAVTIMYCAGLRYGEACGLRMTDVDFLRRIIRVETQYSTYGEGSTADASKRGFAVTKTRNSVREIPVPESLLHAINAHVARYGLSYAGTICVGERTRVVNGARARAPMTRKRWDRAWGDACTSTGIAGFTAHSLRHAFGSEHLAAGIPPADCAAWLGHTVDTFLRTYARPTGERARPTIDMLAAETCTNRAQGESAPG